MPLGRRSEAMESPSSTVRRRAWINSSRQRPTLEEADPLRPTCSSFPSTSIVDDDVFADGCCTGKIENWLQDCGLEAGSENGARWSFESLLKANNFDDELSLGADAFALSGGEETPTAGLSRNPSSSQMQGRYSCSTPRQKLCLPLMNLGHSMASSCFSSSTCKTASSVSEVLHLCSEDAEETLYELGFGCDEPQVTVRIPPRFFTFPSQAQGINFRLFLDAQLRRIREEDPSLTIASRFRQVQVLTAMANAFYSLYSHVSRTPLQKLATPEFTFNSSPVERIERFRSSVRSEPRSPVERLKETVSKMCLYTGSPRGSDSTSPQPSPRKRSSLPDVVGFVLNRAKADASKKLEYSTPAVRVTMTGMDGRGCEEKNTKEEEWRETGADERLLSRTQTETADLMPADKVTFDQICPQIVESVHRAPFCHQHTPTHTLHARVEIWDSNAEPLPGMGPNDARTGCCITVSGWEGDAAPSTQLPPSAATHDTHTSPVRTCEGSSRYLDPLTHQHRYGGNLQPVNSFELEEVHSAGEDDCGLSETKRGTTNAQLPAKHRGAVARGDSVQSDSSGYADEETGPVSDKHHR